MTKRMRLAVWFSLIVASVVFSIWYCATIWPIAKHHPGLVAVLIGVVGEVALEWKEMVERRQRLKRLFSAILVLGLAWEFIEAAEVDKQVAVLEKQTADERLQIVKLEQQIAKTSNSVVKVDPLNQPISDISAVVTVVLDGTNSVERPKVNPALAAIMSFAETNTPTAASESLSKMGELAALVSESFIPFFSDKHPAFIMSFHPLWGIGLPHSSALSAGETMDRIRVLQVWALCIPYNSAVLSGTAQVLINGGIRKQFEILPQKSLSNAVEYGFTMVITNFLPRMSNDEMTR